MQDHFATQLEWLFERERCIHTFSTRLANHATVLSVWHGHGA